MHVEHDLTATDYSEQERADGDGFWQATLDSLSESLAVLNHDGDIVAVNNAWVRFAEANGGAHTEVGVGVNYLGVCDRATPEDPTAGLVADGLRAILDGVRTEFDSVYPCHAPDQERWFAIRMAPFEGPSRRVVVTHAEITERHQAEVRSHEQADFLATVTETMPGGLVVVDGDGRITLVNDNACEMLGWPTDQLVGRSMHDTVHGLREDGTRLPAEECPITRARVAGTSIRVDDDAFQRGDGSFLPVSYAVAPFSPKDGDAGSVVVFGDITESKSRELAVRRELDALSWVGRIRDALEDDRFVLYAQPIINIASGATVQHELLARMVGPKGEVISPTTFLPVAEEHGLIHAIDRRVVALAMRYAVAGHSVQINLSADSISEPGMFRFVCEQLEGNAVDPELLVFEITETALIHNEVLAQAFIENVRSLRCGVALDDFGTGYGSFRYLKRLPVNLLKIDQEFVQDLDGASSSVNRHVIEAIVTLARGMGQATIAEGVETGSSLAMLRQLGVDFAQGYLFARPAPATDVFQAIEKEQRTHA